MSIGLAADAVKDDADRSTARMECARLAAPHPKDGFLLGAN